MTSEDWKIIGIVGPTSSNKTELSIELANILNGEIISADSRQIYKDLNIGTGKPRSDQLKKVKHHLISAVSPEVKISAYQYQLMADSAFRMIANKGLKCLLTGGTGLWIKAFCDGLTPTPPPNPEFRQKLLLGINKNGLEKYYSQLIKLDPGVISKIKQNDKLRIIRALEIIENSSLLPSEIKWNTSKIRYKTFHIGCHRPKNVLYQIAEQKITTWISQGWIDEVECLLAKGIDPNYPAMKALGYSHIVQYLDNRFSKTTLVDLIKRDTRRYIKRQLTWFRADKRIHWIDTHRPIQQVVQEALDLINNPV